MGDFTLLLAIIFILLTVSSYLLIKLVTIQFRCVNPVITSKQLLILSNNEKKQSKVSEFYNKINEKINEGTITDYVYIVIDIDDFKMINKLYGELEGNELLSYIQNVIKKNLRDCDIFTVVEADIFALLMHKEKDSCGWYKRVENITYQIMNYQKKGIEVIPSTGIYEINSNKEDLTSINTNAYLAKKVVKGSKSNLISFYGDEGTEQIIEKKKLLLKFKKGIENRDFKLYFQTQIDIRTKQLTGAEVLVRWYHPDKGIIGPSTFIDLFEETGDIIELDLYVFEETCRILAEWKYDKYNLNDMIFSVNVSRNSFMQPNIALKYYEIADIYSIKPYMLELELTESSFLGDSLLVAEQVRKFRDYGFNIAIDDFGSGYSSLNVLKDMDITTLKIDKVFLENDLHKGGKATNIIEAVIKLAKDINLKVVVEGIETESQRDYLAGTGCDIGQGYYFSKPMAAEVFKTTYLPGYNEEEIIKLRLVN